MSSKNSLNNKPKPINKLTLENDKTLLEGIISDYFNSVEDSFNYRIKNEWKIKTSIFIFTISTLFLVFNIIPILPGFNDSYFLSLFMFIKNRFNLHFDEYNFWLKWLLGSIVSIVAFGIAFVLFKYWENRESKKALQARYMTFCYGFSLRKEIKSYLINENQTHLENTITYFEKLTSDITKSPFFSRNSDHAKSVTFVNLRKELVKKYGWIEFTEETNYILDSLSRISSTLERRLNQKIELERTLPLIDFLVLYEFSKIKPNLSNPEGQELKDQRVKYIKEFAIQLNTMEEIEDVFEENSSKQTRQKIITSTFDNLFSNSNILIMLISWLILLTIIFIPSSILVIKILEIKIDSTILIGLLTAPFVGAITFVTAIYSRNKK